MNQVVTEGGLDASPMLIGWFTGHFDFDTSVIDARRALDFFRGHPNPCALGRELMPPELLRRVESRA